MADSTQLKDLAAKIDVMFAVMEQAEECLLAGMEQQDERVNLMGQSLLTMSKCLEPLKVAKRAFSMEDSPLVCIDLMEEIEHRRNQLFYTQSVKIDFSRIEGKDVFIGSIRQNNFSNIIIFLILIIWALPPFILMDQCSHGTRCIIKMALLFPGLPWSKIYQRIMVD